MNVDEILSQIFFYFYNYKILNLFETCFLYRRDHVKIDELCYTIGMIYVFIIFCLLVTCFNIIKNISCEKRIFLFILLLIVVIIINGNG